MTSAQLWLQLCTVVRAKTEKKEEHRKERKKEGVRGETGENLSRCPKIIDWDQKHRHLRQIHHLHPRPFKLNKDFSKVAASLSFPLPLSFAHTRGQGLLSTFSKISCSDSSFSPNAAIMKSYAIVESCGFGEIFIIQIKPRGTGGKKNGGKTALAKTTMMEIWSSLQLGAIMYKVLSRLVSIQIV